MTALTATMVTIEAHLSYVIEIHAQLAMKRSNECRSRKAPSTQDGYDLHPSDYTQWSFMQPRVSLLNIIFLVIQN
jgi:hypothetical protein